MPTGAVSPGAYRPRHDDTGPRRGMPTGEGAWGPAKAPSGHRRPPGGLQPGILPAGRERAGSYDDPSGDRSTSAAMLDGLLPKEFEPRLAARSRIRLEGADAVPASLPARYG